MGRCKWEYYYAEDSVERQRVFFDYFLKGEDNAISQWPRVRFEIRHRHNVGEWRTADSWPLTTVEYRPLYLDASTQTLSEHPLPSPTVIAYDTGGTEDWVEFAYTFPTAIDVVGPAKLHLWMATDESDDADVFIALRKVDREGQVVHFPVYSVRTDGEVAFGWIRASHRELDPDRTTLAQPWLKHAREVRLTPGKPVALDIEIWPSGSHFEAGESLRLRIQGSDILKYPGVTARSHPSDRNRGRHRFWTGGWIYACLPLAAVSPSLSLTHTQRGKPKTSSGAQPAVNEWRDGGGRIRSRPKQDANTADGRPEHYDLAGRLKTLGRMPNPFAGTHSTVGERHSLLKEIRGRGIRSQAGGDRR